MSIYLSFGPYFSNEYVSQVLRLLDDLKEGRTLTQGNNASFKKISPSNVHTSTPPLSPKKNALQVRKGRLNHQILVRDLQSPVCVIFL